MRPILKLRQCLLIAILSFGVFLLIAEPTTANESVQSSGEIIANVAIALGTSSAFGGLIYTIVNSFNKQTNMQLQASIASSKEQFASVSNQQEAIMTVVRQQLTSTSAMLQQAIDNNSALMAENAVLTEKNRELVLKLQYSEKLISAKTMEGDMQV